jgi:hypothetical protein
MKTTNALVTYTDLTTMGLVAKGTPATGNRIATVSFINSNYYVNQSASPYNTYTSLRCPPYQTITPGPTNSGTLYYLTVGAYPGNYGGFSTCTDACAHTTGGSVTVYWYGTLGLYTYLYMDPDGIINFDGGGLFSLNGYCVGFDASVIIQFDICAAPSGVVFTPTSGLYPVSGMSSSTVVGDIVNNTSSLVYMHWKFNSAGVFSGTIGPGMNVYRVPPSNPLIGGQIIGSWSGFGSELIQSMINVNANSTVSISITKNDGYGSGSYISIGYSTTPSGTITWL